MGDPATLGRVRVALRPSACWRTAGSPVRRHCTFDVGPPRLCADDR
ncbi:hypothetical protein HAV22_00625 [Massilia sp. TW-1]|uniref:Uncharacterized protein n=1 Tax=Telluria antibiotica TaxID=2717319 RepID=A0ABX0P4M7_9BURK|nr:hypothetical protein [Telluria antibiotica]NIA52156.1 hypothetical protein [Telluria antibiotica]